MKCMKCRVNDANVYITTNINGNIKKECLCEECAKSINMTKFMNMDRMLSRMLDSNNRLRRLDVAMPDIANRFFKAEKEIYEEMLNDVKQINSIFDNVDNKRIDENEPEDTIRVNQDRMIIKKPMKKVEENIEQLKKKLQIAIEEERYEDAAVLRDKINGKNN